MTLTTSARAAFWLALIFAVTMALVPQPPHVPLGDKWQHMAAFATLAVLARYGYPAMPSLRIGERLSFLGALIEVFQSIPALHRDCDPLDWLADTVAIAAALLLLELVRHQRSEAPHPTDVASAD